MRFNPIPWKYDEGGSMWGCWYGDLVVRYFIWPEGRRGKFRVTVGYNRTVGTYSSLEAAQRGAQHDLERTIMTAIIPETVAA